MEPLTREETVYEGTTEVARSGRKRGDKRGHYVKLLSYGLVVLLTSVGGYLCANGIHSLCPPHHRAPVDWQVRAPLPSETTTEAPNVLANHCLGNRVIPLGGGIVPGSKYLVRLCRINATFDGFYDEIRLERKGSEGVDDAIVGKWQGAQWRKLGDRVWSCYPVQKSRKIYKSRGRAGSYTSASQLYREAKRRGLDIRWKEVKEFVARHKSESLYRPSKLKDLVTFAAAVNHKWQLDLGFYPPYKGFSSFLVCVDVLSRKCYLRVLKGKTSQQVANAFEDILKQSAQSPSYVVSDRGSEFIGAAFRQVLASRAIAQYFANPPHKAALAERVIGSLKQSEGRLAQAFPGRNWPDRLESVVEAYNESVHSATGLAPNDVGPHNANQVFRRLYRPFAGFWDLGKLVPLGTPVRLRLTSRGTFAKANSPRNSSEVYFVGRIRLHPGAGFKYKLFTAGTEAGGVPIAGTYERDEIVPVKLPQE